MLRASGVNYDMRKVDRYGIYERFDFACRLGEHGDVYDRYMIRHAGDAGVGEDSGAGAAGHSGGADYGSEDEDSRLSAEAGEAYGRIEAPKGELGFYLISDGSPNPYRYRVRPPSLINLTVLEDMCLGWNVADTIVIFGTRGYCAGRSGSVDCRCGK